MKFYLIPGFLITLVVVAGMTVITQATISPKSNSSQHGVNQNLIAASSLEQSVHNKINQYRQTKNLPPLAFDETIANHSRAHSAAMANAGRISHKGFDRRAAAIGQTITYSSVAENVASNQGYENPDNTAVKGWIKSPGHHQNIVGNFDMTGIGVVKQGDAYYFTQIFVNKK